MEDKSFKVKSFKDKSCRIKHSTFFGNNSCVMDELPYYDFAETTESGHILGSNSEISNLLPVAVE